MTPDVKAKVLAAAARLGDIAGVSAGPISVARAQPSAAPRRRGPSAPRDFGAGIGLSPSL
jgi:hypothetical protein